MHNLSGKYNIKMFKQSCAFSSCFSNTALLLLFDYILSQKLLRKRFMSTRKNVKTFGLINTIEGYSYLLLLFVAMPMKYMLGIAIATKIVGMAHGILFMAFMYYLLIAWQEAKWSTKESVIFFIAALIPFGTFYTKSKIAHYETV